MPHPKPLLAQKYALKNNLLARVESTHPPGTNGHNRENLEINRSPREQIKISRGPRPLLSQVNYRLASAVAIVGLLLVGFIGGLLLLGAGLWFTSSPAGAQKAHLELVSGTVEMANNPSGAAWEALDTGDTLQSGQRIRTGPESSATLLFFDGSRTILGPNADLTFNRIDGDRGNVLRVVMTQNTGKSNHQVVPLRGKKSSYLVFTPSGAVSVHGTQFSVDVGNFGKTRFAVETGKVLVANQDSQVYMTAGQTLSALPKEQLDTPDYQFSLHGTLTSNEGSTWIVAGVSFKVVPETSLVGDLQLYDIVLVEGHIQEDSIWVADRISAVEESGELRSFSGALIDLEGEEWQVDNQTFLVNSETDVEDGLTLGTIVKVSFVILPDGQWQAISVEFQEEAPGEPTPTPTPDPDAAPVLVFDPAELQVPVCMDDVSFNANLLNNGPEEDDVAVDVVLDYAILSGGEYVDSVSLDPTMWELIAAGESEAFTGEIDLAETWETVAIGTSVEMRVFIASEANTPEGHPADLNLTLVKECNDSETPTITSTLTDTLTVTPTITMTPTITTTPILTDTVTVDCTGANPHPKATKLAGEYSVSYEEIMGWFCQNYGFGEIDQAYGLSLDYGVPVVDIFNMRASGLGWGQIKQALAKGQFPTATPLPDTDEPPEATETPKPPDANDDNDNGDVCSSPNAKPHPKATKLAREHGVSYAEIIDWHCQGFSFGDIGKAYGFSEEYNAPVDDIFSMRSSGMGWGQIKKALAARN